MSTLLITRGDSVSLQLAILQGGNPMNLTGCNVWFTVKQFLTDDDAIALIQKNISGTDANGDVVETGVTVQAPATGGIALLTLTNADTQALTPNNPSTLYYFDVQVEDASGNVFTALIGRLQVQSDVTQSV